MFSQSAEYVLRVVVYLAGQTDAVTNKQIAQATHVPEGYLAKLLQALGRAGMVDSQRGLHGGFVLARDPDELSVLEIVQTIDPIRRIRSCPLGLKTHGANLCPLHRRMDDALASVEEVLRNSTISELLQTPTTSKPLCDFPATTK